MSLERRELGIHALSRTLAHVTGTQPGAEHCGRVAGGRADRTEGGERWARQTTPGRIAVRRGAIRGARAMEVQPCGCW